jgi:dTDP-4-amino-4,6-dideoxygalactose transaminase
MAIHPEPALAAPIPFNRATVVGGERRYLLEALASEDIGGTGPFARRCEALLEKHIAVPRALLTTSCTHALEMCALLLDLGPGDEVIMPSYTYVGCANAVALRKARPVFADIRPDSLTLDPAAIEPLITSRTKAVMLVHYAGISPDVEAIAELAKRRGLVLIEDNAHGAFARQGGRQLGTFGALATLSFHATKNITCGEGGALLVNDRALIERAEIIRDGGTDRSRFRRGEVGFYEWQELGSSYSIGDLLAAALLAQLESRDLVTSRRRALWERYAVELQRWAGSRGVALPFVPAGAEQPYHIFYLVMPTHEARTEFIAAMDAEGVHCAPHYVPLHASAAARRLGLHSGCGRTEDLAARVVRLPLYTNMTEAEQARAIEAVLAVQT